MLKAESVTAATPMQMVLLLFSMGRRDRGCDLVAKVPLRTMTCKGCCSLLTEDVSCCQVQPEMVTRQMVICLNAKTTFLCCADIFCTAGKLLHPRMVKILNISSSQLFRPLFQHEPTKGHTWITDRTLTLAWYYY